MVICYSSHGKIMYYRRLVFVFIVFPNFSLLNKFKFMGEFDSAWGSYVAFIHFPYVNILHN